MKIVLRPLRDRNGIVPLLYTDGKGREPIWMAQSHGGEVVFGHQSGYGFLRREDVEIRGAS